MRAAFRQRFRARFASGRWFLDCTDASLDYEAVPAHYWSYLAGLIDGEGSLRLNSRVVHLEIANTHVPVLEEAARRLGGVVKLVKASSGRAGNRPCYEFYLWRGNRVLAVLLKVFEHLRIKRWQAALSIMYLKRNGHGRRTDYDHQLAAWLKQANRREVAGAYRGRAHHVVQEEF
jgi:hypothetical protein